MGGCIHCDRSETEGRTIVSDIAAGIQETLEAAQDMQAMEAALRIAVSSVDESAMLAASLNYFRGEDV
jgi:hypothetical protein